MRETRVLCNDLSDLFLAHFRADVIELCHGDGCCLPDVRILVFQTIPQGLAQVLGDLVHTDAAHSSNSESPASSRKNMSFVEIKKEKCVFLMFSREINHCASLITAAVRSLFS